LKKKHGKFLARRASRVLHFDVFQGETPIASRGKIEHTGEKRHRRHGKRMRSAFKIRGVGDGWRGLRRVRRAKKHVPKNVLLYGPKSRRVNWGSIRVLRQKKRGERADP